MSARKKRWVTVTVTGISSLEATFKFFINLVETPKNGHPAPVDRQFIYKVLYIPGGAGFLPSTVP